MKKMKKLLTVMLSLAMILSLSVTAFATTPPEPETDFDTPVKGNIDAQVDTQGGIPAKPISIILPTVPARQTNVMRMFDMILDSHSLIKATAAAAYADSDGKVPTFADDTKLFFPNTKNNVVSYSGTSDSLKVINTGFVPVDVDMKLTLDKGGDDFELVEDPEDLEDSTATVTADAQMYLAVVADEESEPVLDPAANVPEISIDYDGDGDYINDATDDVTIEFEDPEDAADDTAKAALEAAISELKVALNSAKITLSFVPSDDGDPTNQNDDTDAMIEAAFSGSTAFTSDGDDTDVASTLSVVIKKGNINVATVEIPVKAPDENTMDEDEEQEITFKFNTTGAELGLALGVLADSYKLDNTKGDSTLETSLAAKGIEVSSKGYYWKQVEETTAKFPTLKFHMTGNINETDKWDTIGAHIEYQLTWDVTAYDEDEGRDLITTPDVTDEGGDEDDNTPAVDPDAGKPTIGTVTPATGTTSSTRTATIAYTAGTGNYANYQPTVLVYDNATLAVTAGAGSVTVNTRYIRDATTFALRFVDSSDSTKTVDIPITDALWT